MIIYGPEGCGKTAFFKQAMRLFEEYEYVVTYFSPLEEQIDNALYVTKCVRDLVKDVLDVVIKLIIRAEFARRSSG